MGVVAVVLPRNRVVAQEITIIATGDIEWSRVTKAPGIFFDAPGRARGSSRRADGWIRVPYVSTPETRQYLETVLDTILETPESHHIRAIHYGLAFESAEEMAHYPFHNVLELLRGADIAFANLETPLSDDARYSGAFRTPTDFAGGLRWAGFDVVSTANNHALDAEGEGLMNTIETLRRAGVGKVGSGSDLEDARRPFVIERNGVRIAFLGYAMFLNVGSSGFALESRAGVVPLDPFIIREDIARIRSDVDHVVLSFHWGIENTQDVHPAARAFAHEAIDAGADIIIGHHPHLPRGIELYHGKLIAYSLGNFVFGHSHTYWMDNYLVRVTLDRHAIKQVEVLPIAGTGSDLAQPYPLTGERAQALLQDIRDRSEALGTQLMIEAGIGVIRP